MYVANEHPLVWFSLVWEAIVIPSKSDFVGLLIPSSLEKLALQSLKLSDKVTD